jgi:hypothetical protein
MVRGVYDMDVGEPGNFSNPKARPSVPYTQTIGPQILHRFHTDPWGDTGDGRACGRSGPHLCGICVVSVAEKRA